jgi:hypothetical protein
MVERLGRASRVFDGERDGSVVDSPDRDEFRPG